MDHIYDYFEQLRPKYKTLSSGGVSDADLDVMFQARRDGQGGLIDAILHLDENAFIHVFERVELVDGRPHRLRYSYYLIVDGAERRGYDRDPTHEPAEHRHGEGHEMEPWEAVSFDEVAEEFWDILSQIRSEEAAEEEDA
jgi:Family of unknown function (DUF6516)